MTFFIVPAAKNTQLAIDKYLESEVLSNYQCYFCSEKTKANQEKVFTSLPEVLFLQLRRFKRINGLWKRDDSPVFCNKFIKIPLSHPTKSSNKPTLVTYRLVSVLNHEGSMATGHYTATVVDRASGRLFLCNDARISHCKRFNPVSAYALVYQKVETQTPPSSSLHPKPTRPHPSQSKSIQ